MCGASRHHPNVSEGVVGLEDVDHAPSASFAMRPQPFDATSTLTPDRSPPQHNADDQQDEEQPADGPEHGSDGEPAVG